MSALAHMEDPDPRSGPPAAAAGPELRAAPAPAPTVPVPPQTQPAADPDTTTDTDPQEQQEEAPPRRGALRVPDIWGAPPPTLREEIARVRRGDHLPEGWLRYAELCRAWASAVVIALLLLLVEANRSAGRQAVLGVLVLSAVLIL